MILYPVDGYGNQDIIRSIIKQHKPDILWFMSDPRFYTWLWDMEDEIRVNVPICYYHVWDNKPNPTFNKSFYQSNDYIVCISKLTHNIVNMVSPNTPNTYLPHSVDMTVFRKYPEEQVKELKRQHFGDKFLLFWNSRNARRKMSGSVVWWFKEFLDIVGQDKATLLMHCDPKDPNGQDLEAIIYELKLTNGEVKFSKNRVPPQDMAFMYNMSDATICVSDAEGFGLSCTESLASETPVIANMTGGLQEQVCDIDKNGNKIFFGVGIEPASKAIIGSQDVPYIFEDRISKEDFIAALLKLYNMSESDRKQLGKAGREHLLSKYNPITWLPLWDKILTELHEKHGSWESRKTHKTFSIEEI